MAKKQSVSVSPLDPNRGIASLMDLQEWVRQANTPSLPLEAKVLLQDVWGCSNWEFLKKVLRTVDLMDRSNAGVFLAVYNVMGHEAWTDVAWTAARGYAQKELDRLHNELSGQFQVTFNDQNRREEELVRKEGETREKDITITTLTRRLEDEKMKMRAMEQRHDQLNYFSSQQRREIEDLQKFQDEVTQAARTIAQLIRVETFIE